MILLCTRAHSTVRILVQCLVSAFPWHELRLKRKTTTTSRSAHQNERGTLFQGCKPLDLTALVGKIHFREISLSPDPSKTLRTLLLLEGPQREIACWHAENLCSLREQAPKHTLREEGKPTAFLREQICLKKSPDFS